MSTTTNYGWTKPTVDGDADTWGTELNSSLDGIDTDLKAVSDDIATQIAAITGFVPSGAIVQFAMAVAPDGYLECDGRAISRTTYAALFALIATSYGAGDGSTTFNIPDLRGYFTRAWDHGRGIDVGRALGSVQADAFASHQHQLRAGNDNSGSTNPGHGGSGDFLVSSQSGLTGDTETRPKNISLMYCIKT